MSIRVACHHVTRYLFDRPVSLSPHILRLRPAPHCRTPILSYSMKVKPEEHFLNWQQDAFGNYLARLVFPEKSRELSIDIEVIADMTSYNPFDFFVEEYAENYPFNYTEQEQQELAPYLKCAEAGPLLQKWLDDVDRSEKNTVDFVVDLNRQLQQQINYSVRMEPGVQSCETTLEREIGSCRDTAWLLVEIMRHLGLAARFVSGYLIQLTADEKSLDGPSGPEADFTDLHAWTEVYVPGAGWVGLDPTSGLLAGEGHIPLACTPTPASAAPLTGATDPCEVTFDHSNSVKRIHEDPRVTKPYSDEQWQCIDALGRMVDEELTENDVRLTMGGEPTFVSIDDMDGPEWNSRADGPHKRQLAHDLTLRLRDAFAKGGLLHFGQGKWYPGEPLPRWAYSCFWRKDGVALWQDPALLADIQHDYGATPAQAEQFSRELTRRLGLREAYLTPGYEDTLYWLWKEGSMPDNIDPTKADLKDGRERRALAKVLSHGLDTPVGFALPLQWDRFAERWKSGPWDFRRERMFLIPGDSGMGLRLPLDSLPWIAPDKKEIDSPPSLFDDLPELPDRASLDAASTLDKQPVEMPEPHYVDVPHTALCVEAREGRLYIFMPPLTTLESYVILLAAIEACADHLKLPVVIEGYEPPKDWRLERFNVTPDPGVIEVNIHPSANWQELVEHTTVLYEQARQSRLGTEKFMLDGRHTGTGGGNHITLGGPTPADSPMLRRPDVLRSLITFWQHHPGLSYLFSGVFIGPTSQAPRIDEARDDALYELEIAFSRIPKGEVVAPWLVDRLLRNLLIDVTGNTHRAEFCIDKLYSPDSPTGRLGIVELRGFEMPPHARMSLVQNLLIRTLLARFWKEPYHHDLIRWGTTLHDRYLLPWFVRQDLKEVVDDLNRSGYPFQLEWFDPFFEFRFPRYGTVQIDAMELELRFAIEPWHVLGEEVSSQGMSRFVDSSTERLQVFVRHFTEGRHVITCNGRRLPMISTGRQGEFVAGVRYRAWQPPSALHPTIAPHSPLIFDIIDTWNGRSIGGCAYHVSHPGGRNYDVFPVNAITAESRRRDLFNTTEHTSGPLQRQPRMETLGKFFTHGEAPAPMAPAVEEVNEEFPCTLDLRRQ
nr:transglutaminase family protein [uncultured Desulfuromonas sp.]